MNAAENGRMEFLLFRFVSAQDVLSDIIGSLGGRHSDELFPGVGMWAAAHMLVTDAQFLRIHHCAEFLAEVFSYHGDAHDFMFDFGDASRQVCTEVIWRGINGRAGIDHSLTPRRGHPTLSADDLVNHHFKSSGSHFEFVLFAEAARSGRRAVIHTGAEGEAKLCRQMEP